MHAPAGGEELMQAEGEDGLARWQFRIIPRFKNRLQPRRAQIGWQARRLCEGIGTFRKRDRWAPNETAILRRQAESLLRPRGQRMADNRFPIRRRRRRLDCGAKRLRRRGDGHLGDPLQGLIDHTRGADRHAEQTAADFGDLRAPRCTIPAGGNRR